MKKIYVLLAIFIAGVVILSTTVYVPEGYITLSHDKERIYTNGIYPLSTHPFEYKKIVEISGNETLQVEIAPRDITIPFTDIDMRIDVSWNIDNASKLRNLYDNYDGDGSANPIQKLIKSTIYFISEKKANEIYRNNYRDDLIVPSIVMGTKAEFARWFSSDIYGTAKFPAASRNISLWANDEMEKNGINLNSLIVSKDLPKELENAINDRNNIINSEQMHWIADIEDKYADSYIDSLKASNDMALINKRNYGSHPTFVVLPKYYNVYLKGISQNGRSGYAGIYTIMQ